MIITTLLYHSRHSAVISFVHWAHTEASALECSAPTPKVRLYHSWLYVVISFTTLCCYIIHGSMLLYHSWLYVVISFTTLCCYIIHDSMLLYHSWLYAVSSTQCTSQCLQQKYSLSQVNNTRCHAIAKTTARCAQYMSALKILCVSTKAVDDCTRISTLQSYHYSAVKLFLKYSNKCDHGT